MPGPIHNPAKNLPRPILSAQQHFKLNRFWRRQKAQQADAMSRAISGVMSQVMKADGTLKNVASRLGGDLGGYMAQAMVLGIRGYPVEDNAPTDGQGLVFRENDQQLHWGAAGGGGYYEALVTGVVNMDGSGEFIWEDGDLVYDGPVI